MAFRKDKTGVAQTAANTAATLVAAALGAGVIQDMETATSTFDSIREATFADLEKVVDADNEVFAAAEAAAPAKSSSTKSTSKKSSGGSSVDADSARSVELNFGKFKGVTLGELEGMTGEQAKEYGHGEGDKNGLSYLTWLSKNENNPFIAKRAAAILEARKAESDAA